MKITQHKGKSCIKASVIMLPTEDKTQIISYGNYNKIQFVYDTDILLNLNLCPEEEYGYYSKNKFTHQHLYITSDEPIKEGDWCLYNNLEILQVQQITKESIHFANGEFEVYTNKFTTRKIIASTNESLKLGHDDTVPYPKRKLLPQPSQAFIESFVKANGVGFDEVLVKVNKNRCDGNIDLCVTDIVCETHSIRGCEKCFGKRGQEPLIDKEGNTITIYALKKETYTREEVEDILHRYFRSNVITQETSTQYWITDNL
jgi:hypothetical protein